MLATKYKFSSKVIYSTNNSKEKAFRGELKFKIFFIAKRGLRI